MTGRLFIPDQPVEVVEFPIEPLAVVHVDDDDSDLAFARGVFFGAVAVLVFWLVVAVVLALLLG